MERSSVISICFLLDVDECSVEQIPADYIHLENNCHDDATCFNTKGSFYCTCHTGYSGHGVTCIGNDLSLTCSTVEFDCFILYADLFNESKFFFENANTFGRVEYSSYDQSPSSTSFYGGFCVHLLRLISVKPYISQVPCK